MKKPAFEIAIASVVLSTNVVAQQPILVPINTPQMMPSGVNPQGTISGMSGGQNIQMPTPSGINTISGPVTSPGIATISGVVPSITGNMPMNQQGTMSGISGGANSSMKHLPSVNVAQLQAQRAVSMGMVATPMGMAQAYRVPNNPTTYYVLSDGRVYTQ